MFVCMTSDTASILVSFTACVNVEKKEVLITIICPRQTAYSTTSAQAHADIGGIWNTDVWQRVHARCVIARRKRG